MSPALLLLLAAVPQPARAGGVDALPGVTGPAVGAPPAHAQPVGDLDGDGLGDLVVGTPDLDQAGWDAGAAWIITDVAGLEPGTPLGDAGRILTGERTQDRAGSDLAALGDFDGDGRADVAIASPEASDEYSQTGRVHLVYGEASLAAGSLADHPDIVGGGIFDRLGTRLFGLGDLDGDGLGDLGAASIYDNGSGEVGLGWLSLLPGQAGRYSGTTVVEVTVGPSGAASSAPWLYADDRTATFFGMSAVALPDLDGDELPDLLLGSPGSALDDGHSDGHAHGGREGAAWLFSGPGTELQAGLRDEDAVVRASDALGVVWGGTEGAALGWRLSALPDGRVMASMPQDLDGAGRVVLLRDLEFLETLGGERFADQFDSWTGDSAGELFGWATAPTGDLDGRSLVAVGTPGWKGGHGRVQLLSEEEGVVLSVEGCSQTAELGWSVRSHPGPDPHGEDRTWVAMTAPGEGWWGDGEGSAAVLTGQDLAAAADGECDEPATPATDADGDGWPADQDCDDGAAWRNPGAVESCGDGVDDDCDGEIDEACAPVDDGGGCAVTPAGGGLLLAGLGLLGLARRRRSAALGAAGLVVTVPLLLPSPARAQARADVTDVATSTLWGTAEWEHLRGPAITGDFDGDDRPELAVANYQATAYWYAAGEVYLLDDDLPAGPTDLGDAPVIVQGGTEHDYLGASVAVLPASTGPDTLIVGIEHSGLTEEDQGEVAVYRDPMGEPGTLRPYEAQILLKGDSRKDRFGARVVVAGDLDGDGIGDLAISAPGRTVDDVALGRVWLLHGGLADLPEESVVAPWATGTVDGTTDAGWLGWRLVAPGDLDGDGRDDLLASALDPVDFTGRIHFLSGPGEGTKISTDEAAGAWVGTQAFGQHGEGLSAGDADGDGTIEVLVGAPYVAEGGRAWLLAGAPQGAEDLDAAAVHRFEGGPGEALGVSTAVGDTLLIGASGIGAVSVYDADGSTLALLTGPELFGASVQHVGDLDGDRVADAVLFAPGATRDADGQGAAWVVSGAALRDGDLAGGAQGLDADGDGHPADQDCDDADPLVAPDAAEVCDNGRDDDCDGAVDEDTCTPAGCAAVPAPGTLLLAGLGAGLLVLRRRRTDRGRAAAGLGAVTVLASGCAAPELALTVDDGPLAGTVDLVLEGDVEHLVLLADGEPLAGGTGPRLEHPWDTTAVADGPHWLRGLGWDEGGEDDPVEVLVEVEVDQVAADSLAPAVRWLWPEDGTQVDTPFSLAVDVDEAVGLEGVWILVDGEVLAELPPVGPWELYVHDMAQGVRTLEARAVDLAGNQGTAVAEVEVDPMAEVTCAITRPEDGAVVSGTTTVGVSAASLAGIAMVDLSVDGELVATDAAAPWSFDWDSSAWADQSVTLAVDVMAADGGMCSDELQVTVEPVAEPFAVTITRPEDAAVVSGVVTIRAAIGGGEGVAKAELYVDDVPTATDEASPWEFAWDSTTVANGPHRVRVVGTERTTGATARDLVNLVVDN